MSEKSRFVDPPGGRSCDDTGIGDGAVYICIQERDEMDDTKKKFLGLVYLIIGAISLFSGPPLLRKYIATMKTFQLIFWRF